MFDEDYYNTLAAENKRERKEINERKNQILAMRSGARKQQAWGRLYPKLSESNMVY